MGLFDSSNPAPGLMSDDLWGSMMRANLMGNIMRFGQGLMQGNNWRQGLAQGIGNLQMPDIPGMAQQVQQMQQQQALNQYIGGLPQDQQALARIAPGKFVESRISQLGKAPDLAKDAMGRQRFISGPKFGQLAFPDVAESGLPPKERFTRATKLRGEYTKLSKDFVTARDAYGRVLASARDPSAAGDMALIFNYMKVLDPGSVVRESEFATAAATGSFGERIQAAVGRLMTGARLSDEMRADFVNRSGMLYEEQKRLYGGTKDQYTGLAKRFLIDPADVVFDLEGGFDPVIPKTAPRIDVPRLPSPSQGTLAPEYTTEELLGMSDEEILRLLE